MPEILYKNNYRGLSSRWDSDRSYRNVGNCQSTLRDVTEQQRSHLHRGRSL